MTTPDTNLSQTSYTNRTDIAAITLRQMYFSSGIFIAVLSLVTSLGNGFLLLAIWKDPLRTFRIPPTVFVLGLTLADFLTGTLVGPLIAYIRVILNLSPDYTRTTKFRILAEAVQSLSLLTMNASYLVLLCLTWNQFTAIRFPHRHRVFVTTRRVTICIASVWVYAILFSLLPVYGVELGTILKVDFYVHTIAFVVLLVIAYSCLLIAYRKQAKRIAAATAHQLRTGSSSRGSTTSRRRSADKQFTVVTLVLVVFIILCTLPSTILQLVVFYWYPTDLEAEFRIKVAHEVCNDILLLKFALDPFIYCWRLPPYRRALKSVLLCGTVAYVPNFSFTVRLRSVTNRAAMENKSNAEEVASS